MKILEPQYSSYVEISRSALKNNIDYIKENILLQKAFITSVVKGNAYGHGFKQIVQIHQQENDINHFAVFSIYEALKVKESLIKKATILVMGGVPEEYLHWTIENDIEFYIFDMFHLAQTIKIAHQLNKPARIHIEVETGMNRTGFLMKNFESCLDSLLQQQKYIKVVGLCTHFAGAESISNHSRVEKQLDKFKEFELMAKKSGLEINIIHSACSAAALRFENSRMDMLRIGILQYGFWPNMETYVQQKLNNNFIENPLKRVISWKSKIMTIKKVEQGEHIGYGDAYYTNEDKLIAVIPVGYSNGYSRSLSNQARVLVHEEFARVVGIVNMNAISVDITHIPDVQIGDEVILIGRQGDQEISVASFSEFTEQLNYEVLTRLPVDMPRIIVD